MALSVQTVHVSTPCDDERKTTGWCLFNRMACIFGLHHSFGWTCISEVLKWDVHTGHSCEHTFGVTFPKPSGETLNSFSLLLYTQQGKTMAFNQISHLIKYHVLDTHENCVTQNRRTKLQWSTSSAMDGVITVLMYIYWKFVWLLWRLITLSVGLYWKHKATSTVMAANCFRTIQILYRLYKRTLNNFLASKKRQHCKITTS